MLLFLSYSVNALSLPINTFHELEQKFEAAIIINAVVNTDKCHLPMNMTANKSASLGFGVISFSSLGATLTTDDNSNERFLTFSKKDSSFVKNNNTKSMSVNIERQLIISDSGKVLFVIESDQSNLDFTLDCDMGAVTLNSYE